MSEETNNIDAVEGVVDDTPKPNTPEPAAEPDQSKEIITALQNQVSEMEKAVRQSQAAMTERDEVISNHAKAIGFIEGSGIGKYDRETGKIIKVEQQAAGPDPLASLQEQIKETESDLKRQVRNGDISREEYYEQIQDNVTPLKDQYREMQYDQKFNKLKDEISSTKKNEEATSVKDRETQQIREVEAQYSKLAETYPDITDSQSPLFKKMSEIHSKNNSLYANANSNGGKGDPNLYRDLIERAEVALKAEGIDISKQKAVTRQQFATPESRGYQEPKKEAFAMSKQEVGMVVSQGITSKTVLTDLNKAVGQWMETGQMVMDD